MFAVWEPVLPTDWMAPSAMALKRLRDGRVRQFWDPHHLIAAAVKKVEIAGPLHPDCCERKGVLWDLAAAYPPGARWGEALPQPVLLNGPVVNAVAGLDAILSKTAARVSAINRIAESPLPALPPFALIRFRQRHRPGIFAPQWGQAPSLARSFPST
ncbi:MAG TPA: hypothetical protein VFA28_14510 [Bryobacteraceae bacterium]|nr:hypothetical protein [Bryobacteraceae bacterium]